MQTAQRGRPRGGRLGPEGRAWLARAHAEHARLVGADDPQLWREAIREFGYGHRYELARSRWRLAAALAAAGDRTAAHDEAAAALDEAQQLGAAPLTEAIHLLGPPGWTCLAPGRRSGCSPTARRRCCGWSPGD